MQEHCSDLISTHRTKRQERQREIELLNEPPSDKFFIINAKHKARVADVKEVPRTTWDFSCTLTGSAINTQLAGNVLELVLNTSTTAGARVEEVKKRIAVYYTTLKREHGRIIQDVSEVEMAARKRASRIHRVSDNCARTAAMLRPQQPECLPLLVCACAILQKLERRRASHAWVKSNGSTGDGEGIENYERFDALLVADAMSSDDTDNYKDDRGTPTRGLKRSKATWRSDHATEYINFLDTAHLQLATKLQRQMSKPVRTGVRDSTVDVVKMLAKHPALMPFVKGELHIVAAPLRVPVLPRLPVSEATPSSPVPQGTKSEVPMFPLFLSQRPTVKSQPNNVAASQTSNVADADHEPLSEEGTQHMQAGLRRVPNDGKGDCLYWSLLSVLNTLPQLPLKLAGKVPTVLTLRVMFVSAALRSGSDVDVSVLGGEEDIAKHLQLGHWQGAMGDAVLQVLLHELELSAKIFFPDNRPPYILERGATQQIALLKLSNHWEALVPLAESQLPAVGAPRVDPKRTHQDEAGGHRKLTRIDSGRAVPCVKDEETAK